MARQQKQSNANVMFRYAGLGMQIAVSLGIAVFAGYHADRWLNIGIPLFILILPFAVLIIMIFKLIKETSKKKNQNER